MAGLQRSAVSFRRQGSSGLIWDDKLLSGELNQLADQQKQEKPEQQNREGAASDSSRPAELRIERSRSNGGRGYRAGRVPAAAEPPSPKVSAFCFCGAFGKNGQTRRRPAKSAKRVA